MTIDWSYEVLLATVFVAVVFILSAYWSRDLKKIAFLLIGFTGLWLAIAQPFHLKEKPLESSMVDNIQEFLSSEKMHWTDTVKLIGGNHRIEDIQLLENYHIELVNFSVPDGFSDVSKSEIVEGEYFTVVGKFESEEDSLAEIWVENTSGEESQATLNGNNFSVELKAPVKGLYEYSLKAMVASGDTMSEVLPIQVKPSSKMSMLILANNPQFDINYLKNYWVSQGHSILQKVKISQEKFSTNYVNIPEFKFATLSTKVLDRFDILLLDIATWNTITPNERNLVLNAVKENGLGLALKPTQAGVSAKGLPYHKVLRFSDEEIESVNLEMIDVEHNNSWKVMDYGLKWHHGYGSVFLLKVSDSYQLILHDKASVYNQMWASILSDLFVKKNEGFTVSKPFLTYEAESTSAQIGYANQEDQLFLNDSLPLIVNYTPFLDGDGEAKLTGRRGWNKVTRLGTDEIQWFYVFGKGSWETMRANQVEHYVRYLKQNIDDVKMEPFFEEQKIPWWISILLMVFGFGMVWFMEKLKA
ncbi:hypothetical protein [Portibacter lacus]|uniref:Uncharacterized protein n=1 Tax=Portibacter lacus TaxID=1099794 RepID=A0AA37SML3_9BACT|nr:hypothetical protein [Portibacter lacus]GLR17513.1 hypothetical protein GCM10007940_21280 [Portibacter lacus]